MSHMSLIYMRSREHKAQSSAVMIGRDLHTFITKYRAEDAGKSAEIGPQTLLIWDMVAQWHFEQMFARVKSPC